MSGGGDTTIPPDFNVTAGTRVISYAIFATYGEGVTLILCLCKGYVKGIFLRGQIRPLKLGYDRNTRLRYLLSQVIFSKGWRNQ